MRWIGQHRTDGLHLLIAGVLGFVLALAGTGAPTAHAQEKLPAAPSNLQASLKGTSAVVLSWNDNSTNESGFRIWRNVGGIRYALRGETKAGVTAWEESGLSACTTYYYQVTAFNVTGNSDPSNVAQVTAPCPDIYLPETEHDFGAVQVGNGVGWLLEVCNVGVAELAVTEIISTDPQFTITQSEFNLAPGASVLLTVEFAPTAVGDQKAILTISSNDPDDVIVTLTGAGTEPQVPEISLSATERDFGNVLVGESSSWTLTITNRGNVALEVGAIATTDPQFSVSNDGHFTLMPGSGVDVTVTFTPQSPGQHSATLSVESSDPDDATVTLTGFGTEPDIFLSATGHHDFPDVIVGESSTWELVVSNVGSATLAVEEITSTNTTQFAVSVGAFSIPVEAMRSVTVTFAPTSVGEHTATLTILSNDPDQPIVELALTGIGLPGEVTFADADLEAAVREAVGQPEGPLPPSSLAGLAELYASELGIAELGGIEYCANLEVLELCSNDITEIEPLGGLTSLTHLYLNGNRITDISTLSGLQELIELTLSDNQIGQLASLSGLIRLRELDLRGNQISDIGPLSAVAGLRWLMLDWNQISELGALAGLVSLAELGLCGNQVADLAALSELTALTHLYLGENDITDIAPLSRLTNLVELGLWANAISDPTPLSGLTALRSLDLNDNRVNSIGPLGGLTALQALHLEYNRVSDLSALTDLTGLRTLQLDANQITDLSPLEGLTSIGEPWGYPKEREGIEVHLGLSENNISDITALVNNAGIGQGDGIDLRDNPLGTVALSSSIPALRERGVNVLADAGEIPHPELSVSTDTLGFGWVTLNDSAALTVTISNAGDAAGTCTISSDNDQFTVFPTPFSAPAGGSQPVEVTFTPTATGHQTATLAIACSDPSQPTLQVTALGIGTQVGIDLSADEHDFGQVWVGSFAAWNLRVANTGNVRMALLASLSANAEFSASPDSFFVAGGAAQDVTVTFTPTFPGEQSATLRFGAALADQPTSEPGLFASVTLTGMGVLPPQIKLSATEHVFGNVTVDSSSIWTLGISNLGQVDLVVTSISASDTQFTPSPRSLSVEPQQSVDVSVTFAPTSSGEHSAELTLTTNDPDEATLKVSLSGNGVVPPPAVSYVPGAELPAYGQQARVAIQVENGQPVEATLYFRAGGSSQYQSRSMESTGDGVYEAQVPSSEVGLRGLEAYVRVEDELGGISFFPADGNPMSVRVRYTNQEGPALALETWRMVSVPGRCDDGDVAAILRDLGAYDETKWRLFSHDSDGYHEYSGGSTGGFTPGKSFWLYTRQTANAQISSGMTVRTDTTFGIRLQPGWNDIGNPFFFSVRWQDILEESNAAEVVKGPYLYGGDTGWEIQAALQPWKGYAVHNPQAGAFVLAIPARAAAAARPASTELETGTVRLVASVQGLEDRGTFLGWREDALQGLDRWDYPEPPDPPGDFVSVYFPHSQWPGGLYTTDFRPPSRQGTWDFCVRTNLKNRPATLTVHMPSSGLDACLLDVDQGTASPLAGPYCFSTGAGKRSFSLVLGSSEEIAELLDRERAPKRSAVIKSYPNPFNASTVIAYWLPDKKAEISIYNLLGQEVSCLLDGSDGPGYRTLRWDGTDAAGRPLPSGMYVCVLRSGDLRATERLVILR